MNTLYYRVSVKFIIKLLNLFIAEKTIEVDTTEIIPELTTF
jgi:hypothetical protein